MNLKPKPRELRILANVYLDLEGLIDIPKDPVVSEQDLVNLAIFLIPKYHAAGGSCFVLQFFDDEGNLAIMKTILMSDDEEGGADKDEIKFPEK